MQRIDAWIQDNERGIRAVDAGIRVLTSEVDALQRDRARLIKAMMDTQYALRIMRAHRDEVIQVQHLHRAICELAGAPSSGEPALVLSVKHDEGSLFATLGHACGDNEGAGAGAGGAGTGSVEGVYATSAVFCACVARVTVAVTLRAHEDEADDDGARADTASRLDADSCIIRPEVRVDVTNIDAIVHEKGGGIWSLKKRPRLAVDTVIRALLRTSEALDLQAACLSELEARAETARWLTERPHTMQLRVPIYVWLARPWQSRQPVRQISQHDAVTAHTRARASDPRPHKRQR